MNASSREVPREVLLSIFIIELNKKGERIRRRRCLKTKRVPGRSRLTFWCHWRTNVDRRDREREREKKTIRKVPSNSNISEYSEKKECMHWNAWTCDMQRKLHHGLSPIQTYQYIISCTHLNAYQYCYNAHEMQCMKFLRSNLQNPSQKFHKNLFDFEKPQIL